jgi:hypothetical protein
MLTIRKKNQIALTEALQRNMGPRLAKYMLCRFPKIFGKDMEAAQAHVDKMTPVAKEYGITKEEDVAVFLDLSVMYGEDFHKDEWASDVLTDEALSPGAKMDELRERVFESGALM